MHIWFKNKIFWLHKSGIYLVFSKEQHLAVYLFYMDSMKLRKGLINKLCSRTLFYCIQVHIFRCSLTPNKGWEILGLISKMGRNICLVLWLARYGNQSIHCGSLHNHHTITLPNICEDKENINIFEKKYVVDLIRLNNFPFY